MFMAFLAWWKLATTLSSAMSHLPIGLTFMSLFPFLALGEIREEPWISGSRALMFAFLRAFYLPFVPLVDEDSCGANGLGLDGNARGKSSSLESRK